MSRRRKLHPVLRGMIEQQSWRIEIVCSCTGRRRVVGRVKSRNGNAPTFEGATGVAVAHGDDPHTTSVFACPRCPRNLPVRTDARERFTEATRRGIREIDLMNVGALPL